MKILCSNVYTATYSGYREDDKPDMSISNEVKPKMKMHLNYYNV